MSVYVDDMRAPFRGMVMCHMIADTPEELRAMADRIGIRGKWIQHGGTRKEHFDICMAKRRLAVAAGAREISAAELARRLAQKCGANEVQGDLFAQDGLGK